MCVGKDRDVQGEFLLLHTLYREHHCIGGLIHNSQYVLPLHRLLGVSCTTLAYMLFSLLFLFS